MRLPAPLLVVLSFILPARPEFARAGSAYEVRTQSTSVLGSAQAGMTAGPYDLSRLSLNPASLGLGDGTDVSVAATGIKTSLIARDISGSTIVGTPITGSAGGNAGVSAILPNVYVGTSVNDKIRLLRRNVVLRPWAKLGCKLDRALSSRLGTTGQRRFCRGNKLSSSTSLILAAGPIVEYVSIRTNTALDDGTIGQVALGGAFGGVPGGT